MSSTNSIREALSAPLDDLQALSLTLFQSLSPPSTRPPPPPPTSKFIECDRRLADAVALARIHAINQRRIDVLRSEVLSQEATLRQMFQKLESGRQDLENIIDDATVTLEGIDVAKKAAIPYTDLLAYAQSLSAFTSAPPNMADFSTFHADHPTPLFFPPFPNEENMRRGRLNSEAPLGHGFLGESHPITHPVANSPKLAAPIEAGLHPFTSSSHTRYQEEQDFSFDLDLNPDL